MTTLTKEQQKSQSITSTLIEFAEIISLWSVAAGAILLTSLMWV